MNKLSILLGLLFIVSNGIKAQENFDQIVEAEMKAASLQFNNNSIANEFTDNYDLKYHRFEWNIDPTEDSISGSVTSYFMTVGADMEEMYFELSPGFVIDSVVSHGAIQTAIWADNMVHINYNFIIPVNTLDSVSVFYHGNPLHTGFGSFNVGTHNNTPILWTLSEPYGAMNWWPCKQDLNDKIDSIDVFVKTGSAYRTASNGLLVDSIPAGDNTIYHWKHRYPIPAYLIAIAVTNYASYSNWVPMAEGPDLQVLNYVYPEDLASAQLQTPDIVEILSFYNEQFVPYPYADEKYGHAQFEWGGGMEHTTMSFMVNFSYGLMAHELAHQWFGDDITCGSWVDIWLNEGFATYLTALNDEYQGNLANWESWKVGAIAQVTSQDGGSVMVDDTTTVGRIFSGRLTYRKGALLLHMLRWELGDDDFFLALQNYLNDENLKYGYAKTADLQAHLESVSGKDLNEFFSDWFVNQGYPSHTINYEQIGNQVTIHVHQDQSHPSVDFFELTLPLLLAGNGQDTLVKLPLTENDQNFIVDIDFDIQNVLYDPQHWLISKNNIIILSIDELTQKYGVKLYPNPVQNSLNIQFLKIPNERFSYQIIDVSGKVVGSGKLQSTQKQTIDIGVLASGNYRLLLKNSESEGVISFIKIDG